MTAIIPIFTPGKAPGEVKDFSYDFKLILVNFETIIAASVTTSPSDMTVSTATIAGTVVTTFLGGGTLGQSYFVTYSITTDRGAEYVRDVLLNCQMI